MNFPARVSHTAPVVGVTSPAGRTLTAGRAPLHHRSSLYTAWSHRFGTKRWPPEIIVFVGSPNGVHWTGELNRVERLTMFGFFTISAGCTAGVPEKKETREGEHGTERKLPY